MKVRILDEAGEEIGLDDLLEVFPGEENEEELGRARAELNKVGRYWAGGGAAPLFLLMRDES